MSIEGIKAGLSSFQPIQKPDQVIKPQGTEGVKETGTGEKKSFSEMMVQAVSEVDEMQHDADNKIADLITGKGNVTTHEAMVALEKADIAFQLMNQVRSKIVRAYEEVLRTQV